MKIKEITSHVLRNFRAIFICEHCGNEYPGGGYDDIDYRENVLPNIECLSCGKKADKNYRPLTTKYPDGYQI